MIYFWVSYVFQYGSWIAVGALELWICVLLARKGTWRRLKGFALYVVGLFLLEDVGRVTALGLYGPASSEYRRFYWMTEAVLHIGFFLVVCGFFRRALLHSARLWAYARALLILDFFVVLAGSAYFAASIGIVFEFVQNLNFTALVLSTALYLLLHLLGIEDRELRQLLFGIVVEACGQAACFVLTYVTTVAHYVGYLVAASSFVAMLWIWSRALAPRRFDAGPHDVDPPNTCDSLLALSRPHSQITRLLAVAPPGNQESGKAFLNRLH